MPDRKYSGPDSRGIAVRYGIEKTTLLFVENRVFAPGSQRKVKAQTMSARKPKQPECFFLKISKQHQ